MFVFSFALVSSKTLDTSFPFKRYCEFESKSFVGGTSAIGKNICEYAMSKSADTVIVGNRELGRLGRTLVGSVSSYLAQVCPINLVVVKKAPGEKTK